MVDWGRATYLRLRDYTVIILPPMHWTVFMNFKGLDFRLFNYKIRRFLIDPQIPKYSTVTFIYYTIFLPADCTKKYSGLWNFTIIRVLEVLLRSKMIYNREQMGRTLKSLTALCNQTESHVLTRPTACCCIQKDMDGVCLTHAIFTGHNIKWNKTGISVWNVNELLFHPDQITSTAKLTMLTNSL